MGELVSELEWPEGPFDVIYADPPWRYDFAVSNRGMEIEIHYPTMTVDEIAALPVCKISARDSLIFLWATSPKLHDALQVMAAWGFSYRTNMVWIKDRPGWGYYAEQCHELLLIGKRGNPGIPSAKSRPLSVYYAPRGRHSSKPGGIRDIIHTMYPEKRCLELFARQATRGWAVWGAEAPAEPDPVLFL